MPNNPATIARPHFFELARFTMRDMIECGRSLRDQAGSASGLGGACEAVIAFLFDRLMDEAGRRAAVLARIFKTHPYGSLCGELRAAAQTALGADHPPDDLRCLVLLATRGCEPAWNDVLSSAGHQVIPLRDAAFIDHAPMISRLVRQFGLRPEDVVSPDPKLMRETSVRQFNVFHVAEAKGSPYVPAQETFVVPFGVRSVLGFGGSFPSGNMFAVILFLRVAISAETADMFKPLALSVKAALLDFSEDAELGGPQR